MGDGIVDIDETDAAILLHLGEHGNDGIQDLADRLDLSKSTIYYRMNGLKERGIIRGFTADIDVEALGLDLLMITDVYVNHDPGYARDTGQQLAEISRVQSVYYTMGDVDFIVHSRARERAEMRDIIDDIVQIDGVNETSSTIVMEEVTPADDCRSRLTELIRESVGDGDET